MEFLPDSNYKFFILTLQKMLLLKYWRFRQDPLCHASLNTVETAKITLISLPGNAIVDATVFRAHMRHPVDALLANHRQSVPLLLKVTYRGLAFSGTLCSWHALSLRSSRSRAALPAYLKWSLSSKITFLKTRSRSGEIFLNKGVRTFLNMY